MYKRQALYKAFHRIIPSIKNRNKVSKRHDFVGPICETTDKFLSIKSYQRLAEGDNVVICDVGAYGKVLSSNYNLRTSPKEILIKNSNVFILRKPRAARFLKSEGDLRQNIVVCAFSFDRLKCKIKIRNKGTFTTFSFSYCRGGRCTEK